MKILAIGSIGIIIFSTPSTAQEIPKFPTSINEPNLEEKLDFQILEKVAPPPLKSLPEFSLPESIVRVVEFRIHGNTVFSDEIFQSILMSYLGKEVKHGDLKQIESIVSDYYSSQGFLGVGAFISAIDPIPESQSNQAIIKIQIFERVLSDIQISGAQCLKSYIRKRLQRYINKPINSDQISSELQFLLNEETIARIQSEFVPTEIVNESRLDVNVKLGRIIKLSATVNNQRSPSVGEFERGVDFTHRNLTCLGDEINLLYRNTDGSNVTEASYEIPVNADNGSVLVSVFFGRTDIVREAINELDFDSETLRFSAAFRQPVLQKSNESRTEEIAVGFRGSRISSRETLSDIAFPLSTGSNLEGRFRSTVLNLFGEYSLQKERILLLLKSDVDFGLPIGSTNDPFFGDGSFITVGLQGGFLYRLNDRVGLLSRWNGQVASRTLSSSEQFSIGGQNAVRGADINLSLDSGIVFSQEVRTLLYQSDQHLLELAPFIDVGYAVNRTPQVFQDNLTLVSLGIALRAQLFSERVFATFEYAHPVVGRESFRDGSDFKFSLTTRIF